MTSFTPNPDIPNISPKLLQAISSTSLEVELDLPRLSGEDLVDLKAILRGEKRVDVPIDQKRALNALVRSERSPETFKIISSILTDSQKHSKVRSLAALNLSLVAAPETEQVLIQNLNTEDTRLQTSVVKSLGRIGTERAFERLNTLSSSPNVTVQRQVSFARQVIAYRSTSRTPEFQALRTGSAATFRAALPALDEVAMRARSNTRWSTFLAKTVEGRPVQEKLEALWDSTYGLKLNQNLGLEVECGSAKHFLFLNEDLQQGRLLGSLRARNNIAGLLAFQADTHVQHLTVRYLLLVNPSETGMDLVVTRTNGSPVYVGEGQLEGSNLQFNMRETHLSRVPIEITGQLSEADIQLSLQVGQTDQRAQQHGEAV
ncbi:MAG: HEAT repeat domain-containing protein [Leptolyngbya sp. SIO3F4]|nr:HEAT repeat domain-containing protein [Leptolyngbya sp. SIO3F4]